MADDVKNNDGDPAKPLLFEDMTPEQKTLHNYTLVKNYVVHRGDLSAFNGITYEERTHTELLKHLETYGPFDFYGHNIHLEDGAITLD